MCGKRIKALTQLMIFLLKEKIRGKIGTFRFKERKVSQQLKIYKTNKNKFKEY